MMPRPNLLPTTGQLHEMKVKAEAMLSAYHTYDVTMTAEEKQAIQTYALASISRDPDKRPVKNHLIESVIYYWAEFTRPAPPTVKAQVTREFAQALGNWRATWKTND